MSTNKSNLVSTRADEVPGIGMKNIYSMINYILKQKKNLIQIIDLCLLQKSTEQS